MSKTTKVLKEKDLATKLVSDIPQERIDCIENLKEILLDPKINEPKYKKIWKALYYSLWVADKVDIQMDLASRIAKIVHQVAITSEENLFAWIKANFDVFHREWAKLDYWRTNKFLSLARFCLNEIYKLLELKKYNQKLVTSWNEILLNNILSENIGERSPGLTLHVIQIFIQVLHELTNPSFKVLQLLLEPYLTLLSQTQDKIMKKSIVEYIFKGILDNIKQGKFKNFSIEKYAEIVLKKASAKEGVLESNRKFLYEIAKEFQQNKDFVAAEESIDAELQSKLNNEDVNISSTSTKKKKKSEKVPVPEPEPEPVPEQVKLTNTEKQTKKNKIKEKQNAKEAAKKNTIQQQVEEEKIVEVEQIEQPKTKKDKKKTKKEKEREQILQPVEDENGDEDDQLYELPEDWDEEDLDLEALAPYLNGEFDEELTEEEYAEILAKIQSNPAYYFPGQQKEFFDGFTKEYLEKLGRAKKNQLSHNRKVKIHLNKIKIQEFDKEISLGSHRKKAHQPELKSILKKKEKREAQLKSEEQSIQNNQNVDKKKKSKKKVKF